MFLCDERAQSTKTEIIQFHEGGALNTEHTVHLVALMHIISCLFSLSALSIFSMILNTSSLIAQTLKPLKMYFLNQPLTYAFFSLYRLYRIFHVRNEKYFQFLVALNDVCVTLWPDISL